MSTQTTAGTVPEWTLGDRLRKARAITGMTTREFAERIGVSHGTITNAEGDKRAVRPITIKAWALATGVDAHWLETGVVAGDGGPEGDIPTEPLTFGSEGWEFESLRARHLSAVA